MPQTNTTHRENFTIRANEVDIKAKLTLPAICNYFQEVAGNNARDLNFDITDLKDQNMTWVLHRMDINISKLPDWRETVTIETWPAAGDALRAYRNYLILDDDNQQLGNCLSYWMMINLESRRPIRIPQSVLDTRLPEKPHVTMVKSGRMKPMDHYDESKTFNVRRSDLDMNHHVNNARYIEWVTELMEYDEIHSIRNFDIIFMHECILGDTITAAIRKEQKKLSFLLTNQNDVKIAIAEANL